MALKGCGLKRMSLLQCKYRIASLCVDQWIVVLPPAISHVVVFSFPDVITYNLDSFFFQQYLAGVLKMLLYLRPCGSISFFVQKIANLILFTSKHFSFCGVMFRLAMP